MHKSQEILQQLGKRLQSIRMAQNLSPEQLSQKSQVNIEMILSIEEGKTDCDILTLLHLAIALQINITDLFSCEQ